jgi:hypothetical protein
MPLPLHHIPGSNVAVTGVGREVVGFREYPSLATAQVRERDASTGSRCCSPASPVARDRGVHDGLTGLQWLHSRAREMQVRCCWCMRRTVVESSILRVNECSWLVSSRQLCCTCTHATYGGCVFETWCPAGLGSCRLCRRRYGHGTIAMVGED